MPDGVLINGKGPYRYNTTLVPDGIAYETIQVDPGNVFSTSIGKMCSTIFFLFLSLTIWRNLLCFPQLVSFSWLLGGIFCI
jgi:hypothetical protein